MFMELGRNSMVLPQGMVSWICKNVGLEPKAAAQSCVNAGDDEQLQLERELRDFDLMMAEREEQEKDRVERWRRRNGLR